MAEPSDSHAELPLDPDVPLHHRPSAWAWVVAGGLIGTGLRWTAEEAMPAPDGGWPWATFLVNLLGAFVLGALLEFLARAGSDVGWRRRVRIFAGTGICGAFTTYSTLALEVTDLGRHGVPWVGLAYGVTSVVAGIITTWAGIAAAGMLRRPGVTS